MAHNLDTDEVRGLVVRFRPVAGKGQVDRSLALETAQLATLEMQLLGMRRPQFETATAQAEALLQEIERTMQEAAAFFHRTATRDAAQTIAAILRDESTRIAASLEVDLGLEAPSYADLAADALALELAHWINRHLHAEAGRLEVQLRMRLEEGLSPVGDRFDEQVAAALAAVAAAATSALGARLSPPRWQPRTWPSLLDVRCEPANLVASRLRPRLARMLPDFLQRRLVYLRAKRLLLVELHQTSSELRTACEQRVLQAVGEYEQRAALAVGEELSAVRDAVARARRARSQTRLQRRTRIDELERQRARLWEFAERLDQAGPDRAATAGPTCAAPRLKEVSDGRG
jgi:hypothetical protein